MTVVRQLLRVIDVDGADILTITGIAGIAVWITDAFGWPAAIGVIGVCLLVLGLGSILFGTLLARRQ